MCRQRGPERNALDRAMTHVSLEVRLMKWTRFWRARDIVPFV
jgi:hypothetical protein